jgi:hypothetical protein
VTEKQGIGVSSVIRVTRYDGFSIGRSAEIGLRAGGLRPGRDTIILDMPRPLRGAERKPLRASN